MKRLWKRSISLLAALLVAAALNTACAQRASPSAASTAVLGGAKTGEQIVMVMLPFNGGSGYMWSYEASEEGIVGEVSYDEYAAMQREEASPAQEDEIVIDDVMAPGNMAYIFRGERPGEVVLSFVYTDPEDKDLKPDMSAKATIQVYDDKSLAVIDSSGDILN